MRLHEEIRELCGQKDAVILAHNYQIPAVQDAADFVGDSLELARKAQNTDARMIVFAGVDFMAETAKLLNPQKKVLLAAKGAYCRMANMLLPEKLAGAKKKHPDASVVLYVNSSAECKALADCCCTSANAEKIVNAMPSDTVLFGPDKNLAVFVSKRANKKILPVPADGFCYVHKFIFLKDVLQAKRLHPNALFIAHPECNPDVQEIADAIGSTSQMLKIAQQSDAKEFIIGTERDMVYRLQKDLPDKKFYPACSTAVCRSMKKTSLVEVHSALKNETFEVKLGEGIIEKARKPIEKMLSIT
ncbi:MAG: quinolinate synthase NadA [Candidatus Diapherotrites archaeon]|nr:quinolinate synthase NadA [Candidatus Diapherotrites archaeon]